ncbi:hypothetical protein CCU68_03520 [Pseudomonas gingeri NCPPB 3146 = LMG 5327]|uniref:Uncharacterized protein n=2 Tax=Pseudomonas gingeri TaxID=117681 RepID=A0A7Y8CCK2_9PSED|nr:MULTISPECIES: hypothetical protein [Pseudomonas]NVZ24137.1 hypothetical protein [Pseudomonas gingeri]NVZ62376.1 hypothetical protein [Pseudomonas gingeri]NVZ76923.1 hypothetical protein [Pseudomonas gingeri]NWA11131.1 hypothetical protein [Pseudomonas gingeri]NWC13783.1 hypothetical protein [Pseudomonas gingeri]
MNAPLRFNEALLMAGNAFKPFQCVAWTAQDKGDLSLTVIDRTNNSIGRQQISCSDYSDPAQLKSLLEQARAELSEKGYDLQPWTMSA